MNHYEVTIGIPVYNIEQFIRQTLNSALAQTFPSIEFLVCDDCGTDGSIAIVRELQQTHPRGSDIRIVTQPHNMGIGAGRNRMMAEAQGRYFYSLDGDDIIEPQTIELLYTTAQKHEAEIVYGSYDRVYEHDGKIVRTEQCPYPQRVFTEPDEYALYAYNVGIQGMNWNYLINLDAVRRNHLQVTPVGHGYGEDFTYTIDLPTYITRAVLLPDITYHYYNRTFTGRQKRKKVLSHEQLLLTIAAVDRKKNRKELKGRPYYGKRISLLMMLDCSFACEMLVRRQEFDTPFSDKEIRAIMKHPMTLGEILSTQSGRWHNLFYFFIGQLPTPISIMLLRGMSKRYGVSCS